MRYEFQQQGDHVIHLETGQYAGRVIPLKSGKGFSVHRDLTNINERDKIGVVKSIDEAVPALTTYYLENPPQWKRTRNARFSHCDGYTMFTAFIKWTFYGVFTIEQEETGLWVATRCTDALLLDGQDAIFSTAEIARHVVDLHQRDGFSNYPAIDDGFSWRDSPTRVAVAGKT
jgi:hypothetical protein